MVKLSVTPQIAAANRAVVDQLSIAATSSAKALAGIERGAPVAELRAHVATVVEAITQASRGAGVLNRSHTNVLDDAAHRYMSHAARDASSAERSLAMPGRVSGDRRSVLTETLFKLEVSARQGHRFGARSLDDAHIQVVDAPTNASGTATVGDGATRGPVYLGESNSWLDELGNPVRGGDEWAGPDGQRFNSMGEAADPHYGGYVDSQTGESYAGGHFL